MFSKELDEMGVSCFKSTRERGWSGMLVPVIKPGVTRRYQMCRNCVMDTSDEDIVFDSDGVCLRCNEYKERIEPDWNYGKNHEDVLQELITAIKDSGIGKQYDCILGLSGGLDSSYMLHLAVKEWGLRPFVLHIDAGWNLPVAEKNIMRLADKLGVEVHVEHMDWEEIREMQLAWFRSGMESLDQPQDCAFIALVDKYACELGLKYILNGYNICTEIISNPTSWIWETGQTSDVTYMKDVVRKFCRIPINNYIYTSGFKHKFWIPYVLGIKTVKPLNLLPFTRAEMIQTLVSEYEFEPYGQKHFENLLTKFLEGWWIPRRFGHDIRRAQLSSLVITGQMSREEALDILNLPPISEEEGEELFAKVAEKLKISEEEFLELFKLPRCDIKFRNKNWLYNLGIRFYEKLGLEKCIRR